MRRPKHPVPLAIHDLSFNVKNSCYEIIESGITYHMQLEMTRKLKEYFVWVNVRRKDHNIATWYDSLSKEERKQIVRINAPEIETGFYPDINPE